MAEKKSTTDGVQTTESYEEICKKLEDEISELKKEKLTLRKGVLAEKNNVDREVASNVEAVKTFQDKIDVLEKENTKLKNVILAKATEIELIKRDHERQQKQAAKRTKHNPWTLIHQSSDGKDKTEIIKCGSPGTVIMRTLDGVPAIVFAERIKHKFSEQSDGSVENLFS